MNKGRAGSDWPGVLPGDSRWADRPVGQNASKKIMIYYFLLRNGDRDGQTPRNILYRGRSCPWEACIEACAAARVAPLAVRVSGMGRAMFTDVYYCKRYLSGENDFQMFIIATLHRQ